MCEALSITAEVNELTDRYQIEKVMLYNANRPEVNPTETVSAIFQHRYDGRLLDDFRWGLMPYWAKDSILMETRTMLWKPIFDRILKKQRCVIPCTGFYVSKTEGKETTRSKISMRSGSFAIAGLYDVFRSASGEELRTCTLLTTQANGLVSPYQRTMPAILEEEHVERWLSGTIAEPFELHEMLGPMDALRMNVEVIGTTYADKVPFGFRRPEPV
ncbi:putative SOS response-associated peptidase YedK [Paenibacillus phyllosphaerae]|uniref:Abasic site processing protein n=1 Tax=Paenibacillus phyllosphaerae TaxID=274593 RepID=A0A7W5FPW3_9BACL|nr:SOS response-associated peptidase [Paenibacillus phyllosphaerae]MBB3112648.1 putative SOS response-associated peptidase YedK [Paenibacillus phyllosphaerae]